MSWYGNLKRMAYSPVCSPLNSAIPAKHYLLSIPKKKVDEDMQIQHDRKPLRSNMSTFSRFAYAVFGKMHSTLRSLTLPDTLSRNLKINWNCLNCPSYPYLFPFKSNPHPNVNYTTNTNMPSLGKTPFLLLEIA